MGQHVEVRSAVSPHAARTLRNALSLGAEGVRVACRACLNQRRFAPADALKLFGADALIADIAARVRCRCGARDAAVVAAWPRRSRGGAPPEPIVPKEWGRLP